MSSSLYSIPFLGSLYITALWGPYILRRLLARPLERDANLENYPCGLVRSEA